jgi:hypothetical protein
MFLRVKDGFYAGEIREFAPEAARALLASGRAVNPYAESEPLNSPQAVMRSFLREVVTVACEAAQQEAAPSPPAPSEPLPGSRRRGNRSV